ncbi:MAG: glycosyltransferase family 9 protein [Verrucomicrobia bacterium]|nr:glycosyltransferase family 9 protein [Verrucomicrobiota bacterium]
MERTLIIQLSRMGDLIQTLPLLRSLRQDSPSREITLVCLREFQPVVAQQKVFDRLVVLDLEDVQRLRGETTRQNFWSLPPFCEIPEFRDEYGWVVNLTHDEASGVLCEKLSSRHKSGRVHTYPDEIRLLGDWAKYLFAAVGHRTQNLFNLVDIYLGLGGAPRRPVRHYLDVDSDEEQAALADLRSRGCRQNGKRVAFQMGASESRRAWPVEKFAALAKRLMEDAEVEILLLGDQKERALGEQFAQLAGHLAIDLIGNTGFSRLASVLKLCDLLVSNDTGTIHLAAACGTRTVGLYFATAYFAETAPYGDNHVVLQVESGSTSGDDSACSAASRSADFLSVEAVLAVVRMALGHGEDWPSNAPKLAIYRSAFLANGTLVYAPIGKEPISRNYWISFLNRLMWERALGIPTDSAFVAELVTRLSAATQFESQVLDFRQGLRLMQSRLAEGFALARQMSEDSAPTGQTGPRPIGVHERLTETVREVSGFRESHGLLADFFHYELMDLDYLPAPALAQALAGKFKKLANLCRLFSDTLDDVEALVRSRTERRT